jgi:lipopolysaccharide transport system ATP-binding protein
MITDLDTPKQLVQMSDSSISVRDLRKRYRIGAVQGTYRTLRETLTDAFVAPVRKAASLLRGIPTGAAGLHEEIWALDGVSFDVQRGEVVGIIGRNGAGKSTLLKILTRITEPTAGDAVVRGRTGSLLEVGTGFHPELTGRENVYLNGAILGMRRQEIDCKFDRMVDFAEVSRFIDTPVKHYSSGMRVRLAFAVAAHLDPEVLLVDEVLAVGDAAFQNKCLTRMGEVAEQGRTVLFVSHNMTAVQRLCARAICLDQGKVVQDGPSSDVVLNYLKTTFSGQAEQVWDDPARAPGNEQVRIRSMRIRLDGSSPTNQITVRTPFVMEFEYWNLVPDARLNLALHLQNEQGIMVFNTGPADEKKWHGRPFPIGLFRSTCRVPGDLLNNGVYHVRLLVVRDQKYHVYRHEDALVFDVRDSADFRGAWHGRWPGVVRPILEWKTELVSEDAT